MEEARAIVALTEAFPDSGEHAEAWANLADTLAWTPDHDGAIAAAERAMQTAQRSGSPRAMSLAHGAQLEAGLHGDDTDAWHASECMRWARLSGDRELISWALQTRGTLFEASGRLREYADSLADKIRFDHEQGMLAHVVWDTGLLAETNLDLGRLDDAAQAVLDGLGFAGSYHGAVVVRVAAGTLAVRRGDLDTATMHFARARELSPNLETRASIEASPALAEHLIALGQPEQALDLIERCLPVHAHDRQVADLLLLWAARACAHLTQAGRDHDDAGRVMLTQRRLDELAAVREEASAATASAASDPVHLAREALFRAETERENDLPSPYKWHIAADQARAAELGWEAAVADYRHAGSPRPVRRTSKRRRRTPARGIPLRHRPGSRAVDPRHRDARPVHTGATDRANRTRRSRTPVEPADPAHAPGARSPRTPRRRPHLRRDRHGPVHQREDSQYSRIEPAPQDRYLLEPRCGSARTPPRRLRQRLTLRHPAGGGRTSRGRRLEEGPERRAAGRSSGTAAPSVGPWGAAVRCLRSAEPRIVGEVVGEVLREAAAAEGVEGLGVRRAVSWRGAVPRSDQATRLREPPRRRSGQSWRRERWRRSCGS